MLGEIRSALREARDLVKGGNHVEAIEKCKNILKKDKRNYWALILLAAAMKEVEEYKLQTPLVLRKAIEVEPKDPYAWQALMRYYEKASPDAANVPELATVYCKILQLDVDFTTFSKILNKIADLLLRHKDNVLFSQIIGSLTELRDHVMGMKEQSIARTLLQLLSEYSDMEEEYVDLLVNLLSFATIDPCVANARDYFAKYLTLLYKTSRFSVLVIEAKRMHFMYPEDVRPLEWISRVYYERYIFCDINENLSESFNTLLELEPDSMAGLIAKSIHLMEEGDFVESRDLLKNAVSKGKTSLYIWFALSEVCSRLYCWEEVENAAERALEHRAVMSNQLKRKLEMTLVESLTNSKCESKWISAVSMCTKMLADEEPSSDKLKVLRARAQISLNRPEARDELTEVESQPRTRADGIVLRALYLMNRGLLEEAAEALTSLLVKTSSGWLLLGKIYWEMGKFADSFRALLNAVRLDRNNWECFLRLGRYYSEQENDSTRSKRCYQMALRLNPSSEETAIGLCTIYRLLNDTEANVQLLLRITAQPNAPKWAWLRLGLQYLDCEHPAEAIRALQCAIRVDPNDNHCWESLADAYWARGAYTSALRSYQRTLELSPGSIYPTIQLANIKLIIGQYEEAANDFECILREKERYVPALKGFAEARLAMAKENIGKHFLCRARENVQDAVDSLTVAIVERNDISCLWKILADAFYVVATMPDGHCRLDVSSRLSLKKEENGTSERVAVGREELFPLSTRCYSRALSISRDSALLWHNLACSYFARSRYCLGRRSSDESREFVGKALAAAKQAVTLSRTSWLHWNLLGIICMSEQVRNYALAQHCFVMAIDVEPNNAATWSNLGTLYLCLGEAYKANEAFSRAQRADPAYVNSWIGQALIAEKMRNKEAMDLFRHSMELGYHDQAALGYAHWVLTVLLDPESKKDPLYTYIVEKMHAVQVASDALHWYNERQRGNAYALNAHGLLLERSRLYRSAEKFFEEALRGCDSRHSDGVRVNLARIYVEIQRHEEAVRVCREVNEATFNSQCQLALSLFKADLYEESYSAYETALHWLANDGSEKASVLCAMAAIAHIFQGAEDAKTLLFQCLQIQPPLVAGYLAAAALGILHSDLHLATLVFDELKAFDEHPRYRAHIAALSAYFRLLRNDTLGSIRHLSKAIHRYPDDAGCWASLVRLLSATDSTAVVLPRCVEKALFLSRKTTTTCSTNVVQIACASITSHLSDESTKFGLHPAQKIVFSFPADTESWANFIAVLSAGKKSVRQDSRANVQWLSSLISIVLEEQTVTRNLREWLLIRRKKINDTLVRT